AAGRHYRLARSHVSLEQPAHRVRPGHILADFLQHLGLRSGELEPETRQEGFNQQIISAARQCLGFEFKIPAALTNLALQFDELVQSQALPRRLNLYYCLREM